jgi:DNA-binding MarR family transcriptional regulator
MTVMTLPSVSAQSVVPLSTSELAAWRAFAETVTDLNSALEADLAPTGLTLGDYQVLVFLSESPDGSMRMVDLACRLQLSPSGLTRRLDGLVKHGHVDRVPSDTDRRVMRAVITDSGRTALAAAYPVHLASVRHRIIDRLAPGDVDAFTRIFSAIASGLQSADDSGNAVTS